MTVRHGFILLALVFFGLSAWAEAYGPITFTLPPGWSCTQDQASLVCLDHSQSKESNAAIVVSFKNKTPEDSVVFYHNQLQQPRPLKDGEVTTPSEVKLVHEIDLNGVKWVEGVHYNSELKGFFTHYFITVVDPYAVLVTISVHESAYPAAMAKLKPTIDSIKVNAPQPTNGPKTKSQSPPAETPVADSDTDVVPKRGRATIRILGLNIPRPLAFVAIGFLAVLILLLYAIKKD